LYQCPVHFRGYVIFYFHTSSIAAAFRFDTKKGRKSGILATLFQVEVGSFTHLGDSYNSHRADRKSGGEKRREMVLSAANVAQVDLPSPSLYYNYQLTHIPTSNGSWGPNLGDGRNNRGFSLRKDSKERI